jgi:phosphoglycerate kinase
MQKLTVEQVQLEGKRVLMRVDFNVPIKDGKVANDKRIRAALPTIRYILEQGGKLILMSHLGRPKGKRNAGMSLEPCVEVLSRYLDLPVSFVGDCIGESVNDAVKRLEPGRVLLLENLRFYDAETQNDKAFARQLAALGQVYVNDAFGTAHRAHASTEGVTRFIDTAVAGYLMMKELDYLGGVLQSPQKPLVAILGGAKISGKIDVIQNLLPKVDRLLIGGGMAYTFLSAMGLNIGRSLLEKDRVELAADLLAQAGDKLVLPIDSVVSDHFDIAAGTAGELKTVDNQHIADNSAGLDIGPATIGAFTDALSGAQTVVWNGPMGIFEIEATATGTFEIAKLLARLTDRGAVTIIGGGDSAAAAEKAGVADRISHISTGGGASLEFLEGKQLPGVYALNDR